MHVSVSSALSRAESQERHLFTARCFLSLDTGVDSLHLLDKNCFTDQSCPTPTTHYTDPFQLKSYGFSL